MGILKFILKRVASAIFVLVGVSIITFILAHLVPVNPVVAWVGRQATSNPKLELIYIQRYHLNSPLYVQFFYYIWGILHLDLGYSPTKGEPVINAISQTLPYTLQLLFFSSLFAIIIGIAGGMIAAKYSGKFPDRIVSAFYIFGTATPAFFTALLLIVVAAFLIPNFPTSGPIGIFVNLPKRITGIPLIDALLEGNTNAFLSLFVHVLLPSFALALTVFGFLTRLLKTNILDLLDSNFISSFRAKGFSENKIFFNYALRNSLIPIVTLASIVTIFLLVGDVFVENIFSYPGMGQFLVQAAEASDYPAILAITLVYAIIIVIVNLVADLLYVLVDPRIRYG